MKKITFLLLTILPILVFGQVTIESFTFDADAEGFVPGNASDTSVTFDATNYYSASGAIEMGQLTVNKVIKKTGISSIDALGDYTLKFKVRGTETGANIKGNLRTTTNYAGTALMMSSLPTSTGDDGATWYEYSTTVTIATLNLTNSQIQIQTNTLGTYYIDDVEVIKEPLAGNALTVNIVGAGTVTKSPDQTSYDPTDVVTLTANPSTHWNFDSWSDDLTGSTNPETLLMDADKTVTANFSVDPTFDYAFTFDTDGELESWTTDPQVSVASHTGGLVTFSIVADQWARINLQGFPIPSASYNKVTITLQNETTNDELGFIVDDGAPELQVQTISTSDTGIQSYEFDLTQNTKWTGDVDYVRLRIAESTNSGQPLVSGNIIIDDITFSFDASLSSKNFDKVDFTMYPNPAQGQLNFNYQGTINKVQIFDITGKTVIESGAFTNSTQLNISNLNQGIYLVKLTDESSNSAIKKLIVN